MVFMIILSIIHGNYYKLVPDLGISLGIDLSKLKFRICKEYYRTRLGVSRYPISLWDLHWFPFVRHLRGMRTRIQYL